MRIKKAMELRRQLVEQHQFSMMMAKSTKMTASELFQRKIDAENKLPNDTPNWVKEFANGYFECLFDELYRHYLEFCYVNSYGELLSVDRKSSRYYEDQGYAPHDLSNMSWSGHFWKGSDKAFSNLRKM